MGHGTQHVINLMPLLFQVGELDEDVEEVYAQNGRNYQLPPSATFDHKQNARKPHQTAKVNNIIQ